MAVTLVSFLLLFGGGGGTPPASSVQEFTATGLWTNLGSGGAGPGSAWHNIINDVVITTLGIDYGLTGNRPTDSLASSGKLRYDLRNDEGNTGATLGWYSPYHASKRDGWGPGVEQFLWMSYQDAASISSITRSGTTVTVTTAAPHSQFADSWVSIEGADQAAYNWMWRVASVPSSTTFTFEIDSAPVTPATGTLTYTNGRIRFWGRVDSVDPEPGPKGPRRVHVTAYDRMRDLIDADLYDIDIQLNKTEDLLLEQIFLALDSDIAPRSYYLDSGIDQVPVALDDLGDGTKAGSVIADLLRSTYGIGAVIEDGRFRYISRNTRATSTASHSFSSTMTGLQASSTISKAYNLVRTTTHPRTIDEVDVVLYAASGTPPYVEGNATITVEGAFRSPDDVTRLIGAASTVTIAAGADYAGNAQPDGQGSDLTSNLSITTDVQASRVSFTIQNTSSTPAYLVNNIGGAFLQIRGKGIYDDGPRTFPARSAQSYGVRSVNLDLPYQNVDATGQQIADFILDQYEALGTQVDSITLTATPANATIFNSIFGLDIGDVITLQEPVTAVNVDAMILGVTLQWLTKTCVECTWLLGPKITLEPPDTPTNLTSTNLSDGDLMLSWTTGTAGSYTQIYKDDVYFGTAGIGATQFQINNLTRATDYAFKVRHMYFGMPSGFTPTRTGRPIVEASGGNLVYDFAGYRWHVFTSSGTFTQNIPGRTDILCVGGGGGGGGGNSGGGGSTHGGGGGGGGGVAYLIDESEPAGLHAIEVGSGGLGADVVAGSNGGTSSYRVTVLAAFGGGGGAAGGTDNAGASGGSGGGGAGDSAGGGGTGAGGIGGTLLFHNGGTGGNNPGGSSGGGGGGGAGSAGGNSASTIGGSGGSGVSSLFDLETYAGGGVGGRGTSPSAGDDGAGTGGGGGQIGTIGSNGFDGAGFNGGSGKVIIKYPIGESEEEEMAGFNIRNFGAVGDGITDDTAAIQAAYDAVDSTYGGTVIWPGGFRYAHTGIDITTPHTKTLGVGIGGAESYLMNSSNRSAFVVGDNATYMPGVQFEGLFLRGNSANNSSGHGIIFQGCENPRVYNCQVYDSKQNGIHFTSDGTPVGAYGNVTECYVNTNKGDGIHVTSNVYGVHIVNNLIAGNGKSPANGAGIYLDSGDNHKIIGNDLDENENAVLITNCSDCTITGNGLQQNDRNGVYMDTNCSRITIGNNTMLNCSTESSGTYVAVYLDGADFCSVEGNIIAGPSVNTANGVLEASSADNNTIVGNTIQNTSGAKIVKVGSSTRVANNIGYVNYNSGSTSVADGGTVSHGLATTPTKVRANGTLAGTIVNITALGASTFTVDFAGTTTTQTIYWEAEV